MAKVRSPNYPSISLPKAIELAAKVYQREHTHKAAPEVVAKALGYSGLNGASLSAMSALKKYGLLEEVGKDFKISQDALTILVDPKDSAERSATIRRAALAPALFAEFQRQYGDTLPSDENLRAFLLKRGFSPTTVDAPIRSYRETIGLVTELPPDYTDHLVPPDQEAEGMQADLKSQSTVKGNLTTGGQIRSASPMAAGLDRPGVKKDVFSLTEGNVIIEWPAEMSAESFEDFQDWLKLLVKKVGRAYKKQDDEGKE